jgi:V8-like Glu-specific endopeptidase
VAKIHEADTENSNDGQPVTVSNTQSIGAATATKAGSKQYTDLHRRKFTNFYSSIMGKIGTWLPFIQWLD